MSELAPGGSNARMTKAQVRKYVADMKAAQKAAQEKLDKAQNSGEMEKEALELKKLEEKLDEI